MMNPGSESRRVRDMQKLGIIEMLPDEMIL